jgi:predicted DNA-binding transcriptional regulator YafY
MRTGTHPDPAAALHPDRTSRPNPTAPPSPAGLPPFTDALVAALLARRAVVLTYHSRRRVICPHAIGAKGSRAILLAYQIGGQTSTGPLAADPTKRWRCFYLDEIDDLSDSDRLWQSASNYDPNSPFPAADHVAVAV